MPLPLNVVIVPLGVTRPMLPSLPVNHRFPSGPATIAEGRWAPVPR